MSDWIVYIIQATDNSFYTGITNDIERRWDEHLGVVKNRGAKYFRGRKPKSLVFVREFLSRSEASKKEAAIKRLKRSEKVKLISSEENQLSKISFQLDKIERG